MRRALLAADIFGLVFAYATAALVQGAGDHGGGALGPTGEAIAFVLTLPLWVIAAKLFGLYDRDEEHDLLAGPTTSSASSTSSPSARGSSSQARG